MNDSDFSSRGKPTSPSSPAPGSQPGEEDRVQRGEGQNDSLPEIDPADQVLRHTLREVSMPAHLIKQLNKVPDSTQLPGWFSWQVRFPGGLVLAASILFLLSALAVWSWNRPARPVADLAERNNKRDDANEWITEAKQELERLRRLGDQVELQTHELLIRERWDALESQQDVQPKTATRPLPELASLDETVATIFLTAEFQQSKTGSSAFLQDSYQSVARLLPESRWASEARKYLEEIRH